VLAVVRRRRNVLLAACDWTQAADSPISTTDPTSIVWPVAPQKAPA
jgi:hypothetical protein